MPWTGSEALRNPALASRLRESLEAAAQALSAQPQLDGPHLPPGTMADLLLCILPGYLMQLAIRGPHAVDGIPGEVKAMFSLTPTPKSKRRQAN
jgi:hypothetical protein